MSTVILYPQEIPAGLYSGPFRAETEKGLTKPGAPQVFPVMELALPTGTRLYCKESYPSSVRGNYQPLVESFGSILRAVDERNTSIVPSTCSPQVLDYDRTLERELYMHRATFRRSSATIRLVSPNVSDADSFTAFSGVLDGYKMVRPFVWRLDLRPNDGAIRYGQVPRHAILEPDWPNLHTNARGQYIPVVYGTHDSSSLSSKGMVPTLYVDTLNFYYVVSLGKVKALRAVYKDGVKQSSAGYALSYLTVNGKTVSVIDFTTSQGESAITCDVDGLTDRADGAGDVIANPALQFRHFLANQVFAEWRGGPYVDPATVPLEPGSFAYTADFLSAAGYEGSRRIGGDRQGRIEDEANQWLADHEMRAFWTNDGRLAVKPLSPRARLIYRDDQWLQGGDADQVGDPNAPFNVRAIIRTMTLRYLQDSSANQFMQTLNIFEPSVDERVTQTRDLLWSAAKAS